MLHSELNEIQLVELSIENTKAKSVHGDIVEVDFEPAKKLIYMHTKFFNQIGEYGYIVGRLRTIEGKGTFFEGFSVD
jgi:hypothetical protein